MQNFSTPPPPPNQKPKVEKKSKSFLQPPLMEFQNKKNDRRFLHYNKYATWNGDTMRANFGLFHDFGIERRWRSSIPGLSQLRCGDFSDRQASQVLVVLGNPSASGPRARTLLEAPCLVDMEETTFSYKKALSCSIPKGFSLLGGRPSF